MAERVRDFKAVIKAVGEADGLKPGQFEALVSTYDVDSYGDVVIPGAFEEDIARWSAGDVLPVVWSHQWTDPFSHIGIGVNAAETTAGLKVLGQLLDLDTNKTADQVHRLLLGRRINQFSFAFDVMDSGWGTRNGEEVYELRKLKTHEVGPCLVGVNQQTQLIGAKATELRDGLQHGRELSAAALKDIENTLNTIREVIDLARVKYDPPEGSEDSTEPPAGAHPEAEAKAEDPSYRPRLAMLEASLAIE